MPEGITDRQLVLTLRPFVLATRPVLAAMRDANLLGLRDRPVSRVPGMPARRRDRALDRLTRLRMPGTAAWAAMSVDERCRWWLNRTGRLTTLLAAIPGLGGALADRLPVQDALGAASQGLLLCAVAAEHGVTDDADLVRLLAWVLFRRRIDPALAAGRVVEEDARTAELTADLADSQRKHGGTASISAIARTLWRLGWTLWSVQTELGRRPHGRFYHRWLGLLPLVGMAADYLGERSALRRVYRKGGRWVAGDPERPALSA